MPLRAAEAREADELKFLCHRHQGPGLTCQGRGLLIRACSSNLLQLRTAEEVRALPPQLPIQAPKQLLDCDDVLGNTLSRGRDAVDALLHPPTLRLSRRGDGNRAARRSAAHGSRRGLLRRALRIGRRRRHSPLLLAHGKEVPQIVRDLSDKMANLRIRQRRSGGCAAGATLVAVDDPEGASRWRGVSGGRVAVAQGRASTAVRGKGRRRGALAFAGRLAAFAGLGVVAFRRLVRPLGAAALKAARGPFGKRLRSPLFVILEHVLQHSPQRADVAPLALGGQR
mmetsp:Transcript_125911/g.403092  ORF Transcript_125911/g.403092 Transcript_125911/m.403092 type:complete len:283 (+) Transcript_125911:857-1705(+)